MLMTGGSGIWIPPEARVYFSHLNRLFSGYQGSFLVVKVLHSRPSSPQVKNAPQWRGQVQAYLPFKFWLKSDNILTTWKHLCPNLKYKSLCTDMKSISEVVRNIQTLCPLQCTAFEINKIEYSRIVTCCTHFKTFCCRVSLSQLSKSINPHYKW
jgi:hypothetical protein